MHLPRPLDDIKHFGAGILGLRENRLWRPGRYDTKPTAGAGFEGASLWVPGEGLWTCQKLSGVYTWVFLGTSATITVQENDVTVDAAVTTLDFDTSDFNVTSSPAGEANIALNYGTATDQPLNSTAGDARYQPLDSDLTEIAGLTFTDGLIIQRGASALEAVRPAPTVVTLMPPSETLFTWTNMPAAVTLMPMSTTGPEIKMDASNFRQVRLAFRNGVAPASGADLLLRYSTDFSAWTTIITHDFSVGAFQTSAWTDLPSGAKADNIWFQIWGQDGNATADPTFFWIQLFFR